MKQQFNVTGMSCAACSAHVEKAVRALPGLQDVQVNLLAGSMTAEYTEGQLSDQEIIQAVIDAGYGASVKGKAAAQQASAVDNGQQELKSMQQRIVTSFVF